MTVNASISIRCATKFPRKNQHDSHGGQNGIEPSASFHNACPALSSFSSINAPPVDGRANAHLVAFLAPAGTGKLGALL
ncbi:hypothetical protein TI04_13505 [Achromatium sp. WMS2]|nr:hypothetical protein TI04_13505 [Achromatium sp. WMS2]